MAGKDLLGVPAVRQIMARLSKNEQEEHQMIEKLEKNCKTFDRKGKGSLTADEYFNVVKLQNGIDIAKEEVSSYCMSCVHTFTLYSGHELIKPTA